jgi:hypothetical protein
VEAKLKQINLTDAAALVLCAPLCPKRCALRAPQRYAQAEPTTTRNSKQSKAETAHF